MNKEKTKIEITMSVEIFKSALLHSYMAGHHDSQYPHKEEIELIGQDYINGSLSHDGGDLASIIGLTIK